MLFPGCLVKEDLVGGTYYTANDLVPLASHPICVGETFAGMRGHCSFISHFCPFFVVFGDSGHLVRPLSDPKTSDLASLCILDDKTIPG